MDFSIHLCRKRLDGNVNTPSAARLPLASFILTEECCSCALMGCPVLVWTYGHSLEENFGMVERSWFLGLDLSRPYLAYLVLLVRAPKASSVTSLESGPHL